MQDALAKPPEAARRRLSACDNVNMQELAVLAGDLDDSSSVADGLLGRNAAVLERTRKSRHVEHLPNGANGEDDGDVY